MPEHLREKVKGDKIELQRNETIWEGDKSVRAIFVQTENQLFLG
jgi:hypothetical protein